MTVVAFPIACTPEEHDAIVGGDLNVFMHPADDPVALSVFAKWASETGHMDVYTLVQFAPSFAYAQYSSGGWDELNQLLQVTDGWFNDTDYENFKSIVTEQAEDRRDEAMRYVSDQVLNIDQAFASVRDAFLDALNQYRWACEQQAAAPPVPGAGGAGWQQPEFVEQQPQVIEQLEPQVETIQVVDEGSAALPEFPSPPRPGEAEVRPAPPVPGEGPGDWQQPQVVEQQPQVIEQLEPAVETVQVPDVPLDQVVSWDTIQTENQRALKDAQQVGTRLPFWQLGEWILLGPGHAPEAYDAFTRRQAQHGEVTVVARGSTLRRDPGLLRVSGSSDQAAFRTTIARFSAKRIEFV